MTDQTQFSDTEKEAYKIGWRPKDEFPGKPENWRSAEDYLERGKDLLPIVKAEKRQLEEQVGSLQGKVTQLETLLKAQGESTAALVEASTEAQMLRLKDEQKQLRIELVEARRESVPAEQEAEIQAKLDAVTEKIRTASTKGVVKPTSTNTEGNLTPEMKAFLAENGEWFGKDKERTGAAMAYGEKLRAENPTWTPTQIYAAVAKRNKEVFEPKRQPQQRQEPRVEGGGSGGGTGEGGGGSDGESYSDLPADAKASCERLAPKLVGEGRKFKTKKDYQTYYAREYFNPPTMQGAATPGARNG